MSSTVMTIRAIEGGCWNKRPPYAMNGHPAPWTLDGAITAATSSQGDADK